IVGPRIAVHVAEGGGTDPTIGKSSLGAEHVITQSQDVLVSTVRINYRINAAGELVVVEQVLVEVAIDIRRHDHSSLSCELRVCCQGKTGSTIVLIHPDDVHISLSARSPIWVGPTWITRQQGHVEPTVIIEISDGSRVHRISRGRRQVSLCGESPVAESPANHCPAVADINKVEVTVTIDIGRLQAERRAGQLNRLRFLKIEPATVAESDVKCAISPTRKSGLGLVAADLSQINFSVVIKVSHGERARIAPGEKDFTRVIKCAVAVIKKHVCCATKDVRRHHVE